MRAGLHSLVAAGAVVVSLGAAPALTQSFVFNLDGSQEVPPVGTYATGVCGAVLQDSQLHLSCMLGISSPTGGAIHHGTSGEVGPVLHSFSVTGQDFNVSWTLTPDQIAHLFTQDLYVNVTTAAHPTGEIRGQIRFQSFLVTGAAKFTWLTGSQVAPAVSTTASGRCLGAIVRGDPTKLVVMCNHTAAGATSAHLHVGGPGATGAVIASFSGGASPLQLEIEQGDPAFSLALVQQFNNGLLYVDIHTPAHPSGELRTQLSGCQSGPGSLCLNHERFQVEVDWRTGTGGDAGIAVNESADSGMFWFFSPDNTEILIKVLNGCGVNNRYWVFFAPTTNVGFTLRVLDTRTGVEKTYANELGHQAETVLDTSAFSGCPEPA